MQMGERPTKDYVMLNSGAQRKPPARFGAPSIGRHRVFWLPTKFYYRTTDSDTNGMANWPSEDSFKKRRDIWIFCIDALLANICKVLASSEHSIITTPPLDENLCRLHKLLQHSYTLGRPQQSGSPIPHQVETFRKIEDTRRNRYELFSISAVYKGAPMQLRAELHSEYFTLTTIAEFHRIPGESSNFLLQNNITQRLEKIDQCACRRWSETKNFMKEPNEDDRCFSESLKIDRRTISDHSKYFYNDFWEEFEAEIVKRAQDMPLSTMPAATLRDLAVRGEAPDLQKLEKPILFRNIGDMIADFRFMTLRTSKVGLASDSPSAILEKPFMARYRSPLPVLPGEIYGNAASTLLIESFLPLLEGAERLRRDNKIDGGNPEYVACQMLDGRAVYISSLSNNINQVATPEPLRFLLFVNSLHRWQIGRLIERITYLGTLRLAAIKDLDHIEAANEVLRSVESKLNQLNTRSEVHHDSETHKQRIEQLRESVRDADRLDGKWCDGGLAYRIERSRYYSKTFSEWVDGLRVDRIEGFQRYDEFVNRRMGATWDFVDRLGVRLDRINQKFDSITLASQFRTTVNLLKIAEVAALFAATYYGASAAKSILKGLATLTYSYCNDCITVLKFLHINDKAFDAILTIFSYVAGAMAYVLLIHWLHYRLHRKPADTYARFSKRNLDTPFPGSGVSPIIRFVLTKLEWLQRRISKWGRDRNRRAQR